MTISPEEFRTGMRQLAAAVSVITTKHENQRAGMTATAVMSLTAEPPQIAVAVNRKNASHGVFTASGVFAINVLPHDQLDLASTFAGATGRKGDDRFTDGAWGQLATGAPILLDSVASFDCRIVQTLPFATHDLLVGHIEAMRVEPITTPLLYIDGAWASLVRTTETEFHAYEQIVEEGAKALDDALAAPLSPHEQLHRFTEAVVRLNTEGIETLRQFHSNETFARSDRLATINHRKREVEGKLRELLVRGADAGEFAVADPVMTADAIIGMLNSVHRSPNWRKNANSDLARRQLTDLVEAMVIPRTKAGDRRANSAA